MLRRVPRTKTRRQTAIPADLQAFLVEVHDQIEAGDEATQIESDDLLQCDCADGGLCLGGDGEFGFTYFPGSSRRPGWEVVLSALDISRIARGVVTELELWSCNVSECTFRSSLPGDTCRDHDWVEGGSLTGPWLVESRFTSA